MSSSKAVPGSRLRQSRSSCGSCRSASTSPSRASSRLPSSTQLARELDGSLPLGQVELVAQSVVLNQRWHLRYRGSTHDSHRARRSETTVGTEGSESVHGERPAPLARG